MKTLTIFISEAKSITYNISLDNIKEIIEGIKTIKNWNKFDDSMKEFLESNNCENADCLDDTSKNCFIFAENNGGRKGEFVRSLLFYDGENNMHGYTHYCPKPIDKRVKSYKQKDHWLEFDKNFFKGINKYNSDFIYVVPRELYDKLIEIVFPEYENT